MRPAAASEKKFRALLKAAPDAMVIVDDRGQIELVNAQAEDDGHRERLDGIRVLVVDDQADERELLCTILTGRGAEAESAESADAALAMLEHSDPTVLITDIAMSEQDGYALLRRVGALSEPHRHVPGIAVTAHARAEDRSRALSAGFQAYLSKPIEHARLVRIVRDLARAAEKL